MNCYMSRTQNRNANLHLGINCEIDIDDCTESACLNGATCHDKVH